MRRYFDYVLIYREVTSLSLPYMGAIRFSMSTRPRNQSRLAQETDLTGPENGVQLSLMKKGRLGWSQLSSKISAARTRLGYWNGPGLGGLVIRSNLHLIIFEVSI